MVTTSEKCGKGEWLLKGNELISKYQLNLDNSESCLLEPEKILGLLIWVDGGRFKLASPPAILEENSHRASASWLASFHEALGGRLRDLSGNALLLNHPSSAFFALTGPEANYAPNSQALTGSAAFWASANSMTISASSSSARIFRQRRCSILFAWAAHRPRRDQENEDHHETRNHSCICFHSGSLNV
jgi:hypothetical protein